MRKFRIIWNTVTQRLPHLPRHLTCRTTNCPQPLYAAVKNASRFINSQFHSSDLLYFDFFFCPAFNKPTISSRWICSFPEPLFRWCCWKTQQPPDGQINVTVLLQWLKTARSSRGGGGRCPGDWQAALVGIRAASPWVTHPPGAHTPLLTVGFACWTPVLPLRALCGCLSQHFTLRENVGENWLVGVYKFSF